MGGGWDCSSWTTNQIFSLTESGDIAEDAIKPVPRRTFCYVMTVAVCPNVSFCLWPITIYPIPSVRRHSPSTDLGVIMTALDGGALTLPSLPGPWNGEGEEKLKLALILEGEGFPCLSGFSRVVFQWGRTARTAL